MVGEASGRMQKADCRDEIALPAAMLAWLKCGKQRTRNSRKRFLVFFCSLFVKARVVYRLHSVYAKSSAICEFISLGEINPAHLIYRLIDCIYDTVNAFIFRSDAIFCKQIAFNLSSFF